MKVHSTLCLLKLWALSILVGKVISMPSKVAYFLTLNSCGLIFLFLRPQLLQLL